jgi:TRAP-type transport system small permease protein
MNRLNRWIDNVDSFFAYFSAITIFVMMVWIFLDVTLRASINSPISGTIELTGEYFMVIAVYAAISYTQKHKAHVSVDFLTNKLSNGLKKFFGLISNLLSLIVFIILGYSNFLQGLKYFSRGVKSSSVLDYPLAPALMILSLGILLLCIRLIIESINIILDKKEFQ